MAVESPLSPRELGQTDVVTVWKWSLDEVSFLRSDGCFDKECWKYKTCEIHVTGTVCRRRETRINLPFMLGELTAAMCLLCNSLP